MLRRNKFAIFDGKVTKNDVAMFGITARLWRDAMITGNC
jgi:hypothetical protein